MKQSKLNNKLTDDEILVVYSGLTRREKEKNKRKEKATDSNYYLSITKNIQQDIILKFPDCMLHYSALLHM